MPKERSEVGERLASLLKEQNMTQKELAKLVEVTEPAISCYVKGTRIPHSPVLIRIAKTLNVTEEFLLTGGNEIDRITKLIKKNACNMTLEQKKEIIGLLIDNQGENEKKN